MTQVSPVDVGMTQTPITLATEEVRMATTMTGGVSLAIWMGGVAREIDLLTQASRWRRRLGSPSEDGLQPRGGLSSADFANRNRYARLLEVLDAVVEADVLSGTSAGGINAVMLAYARARNGSLDKLRDIWLDLGALLDLLRDPSDTDVPSLLYGDRRLLTGLHDRLPDLGGEDPPPQPPSTTLYVTTTLLTGEASRFTDSLGTLVQDDDHHGLFTFTEDDLKKVPGDDRVVGALAVAARSTASFPGAFEPAYLPFDKPTTAAGGVPGCPAVNAFIPITRSHWAADGGLLDNQPLDVILQRIFDRPTRRPVRRLLLFVVPTAGASADFIGPAPIDDAKRPYGLLDGLLKDLSAATTQSIATSLRAIVEHNDRFSARTDLRVQLAALGKRLAPARLLTPSLLENYCDREGSRQSSVLVRAMMRLLSTWSPDAVPPAVSVPKEWQPSLQFGGDAERVCRTAVQEVLTSAWAPAEETDLPGSSPEFARFRRSAFENGKSLTLAVLRCAYDATSSQDDEHALTEFAGKVHGAVVLPDRPSPAVLARSECERAVRPLPEGTTRRSLAATASAVAAQWLDQTVVAGNAWERLAEILVKASPWLRRIVTATPADSALATYLKFLGLEEDAPDQDQVVVRLFDLAIADKALTPVEAGAYQKVELVQLSADTRSLLAPKRSTAASKLTGLQFYHFGAFYKRSWRANDWMWGRLDAAGWLVHALLDPRRLRKVAERKADPGFRAEWLLRELDAFGAAPLADGPATDDGPPTRDGVREELAFLDDATRDLPASLPRTSMWLATAWQRQIAVEEVPEIARSILEPGPGQKEADRSPAETRTWARTVLQDGADHVALLQSCPVPGETLRTDKGSPLMVHTLSKAAATLTAAVSSIKSMPGPVKPAVTTAHTIALGGYRAANATKGQPRHLIFTGLVALTLGVAITIQSAQVWGLAGLVLAAIGAYLLTFGVWQVSMRLLRALAAVTVFGVFAALATPCARQFLFGDPTRAVDPEANVGFVGRNVHWLATSWWHPLLVVGLLVLLVVMAGAAFSLPKRPSS
jgi:patatin-related protein